MTTTHKTCLCISAEKPVPPCSVNCWHFGGIAQCYHCRQPLPPPPPQANPADEIDSALSSGQPLCVVGLNKRGNVLIAATL